VHDREAEKGGPPVLTLSNGRKARLRHQRRQVTPMSDRSKIGLRYARELLERDARATLEDVAATSGFGSLPTMRHHFRKNLGTSPSVYRERAAP
jgi:transcriptional regulator GlxA family with amidase domain